MAKIDAFLQKMAALDASDLHLTADHPPMIRLHGDMKPLDGEETLTSQEIEEMIREIMSERMRRTFEEKHDADFAYHLPGTGRFRVNVFLDRLGWGTVMRIIPTEILTLEDLNLPDVVVEFCNLPKGMVVVTGPTGSGKSTTLAAMIDYINKTRAAHVITIEDPIEFVHDSKKALINQREVGVHTRGFKPALRAALREDPDIVLVGEMRDLETVEIAIETAETGHLVFGTLHTNTAASTVDRIIDQFPASEQQQIRTMLSASLKGVIAQTLLKRCDTPGRVAALEILVVTTGIASNIREGKTHAIPSAMQTGKKYGMQMMNDSIIEKVVMGIVDPIQAYRKAVDKNDIQNRFMAHNIPFDPSALKEEGAQPEPSGRQASRPKRAARPRRTQSFEAFRERQRDGR